MTWIVVVRVPNLPVAQDVHRLRGILACWSPRVLSLASRPDIVYAADLGRLPTPLAQALARAIGDQVARDLGVYPALALGAHPTIASIAARVAEPGLLVVVRPGDEAAWLAPQPIDLLPLDPALIAQLKQFGLRTIGAVAALPVDALEAQFGPNGRRLHLLTLGRALDIPPRETDPVSIRIGWRFDGAVEDQYTINSALDSIIRRLAQRLARGGHAARHLMLTLELADARAQGSKRMLTEPTADEPTLRSVARALVDTMPISCGIERLTVDVTLVPLQAVQHEMFPAPVAHAEQLQALLTRLAPRHTAHLRRAAVTSPHAPCLEQRVVLEPWEV